MHRRISALVSIPLYLQSMSLGGSSFALMLIRRRQVAGARSWRRTRRSRLFSVEAQDQTGTPTGNNPHNNTRFIPLRVPTAQDMEDVGAVLATTWLEEVATTTTTTSSLTPTCLFLQGDLGAGKTAFARGFVQGALGDGTIRVTSPTYLLSNTYSLVDPAIEIHHIDLYRLTGDRFDELAPLNLDHVFSHCISLIEWPSRLFTNSKNNESSSNKLTLPDNRLTVDIRIFSRNSGDDDDDTSQEDRAPRRVTLTVHGIQWERCIEHIRQEGYLDDMIMMEGERNS